jgi:Protein of unknown function (DUF2937)
MAKLWLAPLKPVGRMGETLLDRVLCVAGAITLSQAPEFFQQYLQRLGGHLDEARRVLARFEAVARESGLTLAQLIETTRSEASAPVAKLGGVMAEAQVRVQALAQAESALREADMWSRPWVFLRHMDAEIARGTWAIFKPAVPVTAEGFCYAATGMLLALGLYHLGVVWPCKTWSARRAARKAAALKA